MDKLSQAAGFDIPKGAGAHVDKAAAKLIKLHGEDALRQFTKLHFANTQKAKKCYKKSENFMSPSFFFNRVRRLDTYLLVLSILLYEQL